MMRTAANVIAAPPRIGVGKRCQRSALGSTTIPIRRASRLKAGVATPESNAAAAMTKTNDTRLKWASPLFLTQARPVHRPVTAILVGGLVQDRSVGGRNRASRLMVRGAS